MQKDVLVLIIAVMQLPYFLKYLAIISFTINSLTMSVIGLVLSNVVLIL